PMRGRKVWAALVCLPACWPSAALAKSVIPKIHPPKVPKIQIPPIGGNGGGGTGPGIGNILNCGGDGVTAYYCIPLVSTLSFSSISPATGCALRVAVKVAPLLSHSQPLRGRVHVTARGTGASDKGTTRANHTSASAASTKGTVSAVIRGLKRGPY